MEFFDPADQPLDIFLTGNVRSENGDFGAERRKGALDAPVAWILLPAPSHQQETFDLALCNEPLGDFDSKGTESAGDQIGSVGVEGGCGFLGGCCTDQARGKSNAFAHCDLILSPTIQQFAQHGCSVNRWRALPTCIEIHLAAPNLRMLEPCSAPQSPQSCCRDLDRRILGRNRY